jgi:NDP-sugar pyrophosphorylase family protein
MAPTLVVLAAGIGNRYGGLKQMDRVGPSGETLVDYSIFDAARSGFSRVVFVIRKNIEPEFREVFFDKLAARFDVDYVFQELGDLPAGFNVPADRVKPWGTSQAVLVAEPKVPGPFAAINADDFYGRGAFQTMSRFLKRSQSQETRYALVGYRLASTLSEFGTVARGVCDVGPDKRLRGIAERTSIGRSAAVISFPGEHGQAVVLSGQETVSMNFWGFTPTFFAFVREAFERFLRENLHHPKAELYIPLVIGGLLESGRAEVQVLDCNEPWFGVTYQEDKPRVVRELQSLVLAGVYPARLWE